MKRLAAIAAAILVLLSGAAFALPFLIDANRFRPLLESKLTAALARQVTLGGLEFSLLRGSVTADDLAIAEDAAYGKLPFVKAKSIAIRVELWPLLVSRKLNVTGIRIDRPAITLTQNTSGEWNFSSLGGRGKSEPAMPPAPVRQPDLALAIHLLRITGGELSLKFSGRSSHPLVLRDVSVDADNFSAATEFPFTLRANVAGGGTIGLDGKAGPLNTSDTAATPLSAELKIDALDLAASGLTENAPALAGLVSVDGSARSDGSTIHVQGKVKADKWKLAREGTPSRKPVELEFALNHNRLRRAGQLQKGTLHIGAAQAALSGSYTDTGDVLALHMNLDGPAMPVSELTELLPAMGVVLPRGSSLQGGTARAKVSLDGRLDRLVTAGTVALDNTKLANFDLGRQLTFVQALAGMKPIGDTEIQTAAAALRYGPEGGRIDDVKLIVPSIGNLEGSGTISPSNELAFQMRATVQALSVPFTIQGTAAAPTFRPDAKAIAKEQLRNAAGSQSVKGFLKGILGRK